MKTPKTVYRCENCDYQSPKWLGRCPECQAWNSFVEETFVQKPAGTPSEKVRTPEKNAVRFREVSISDYSRIRTDISELDRVLGGGIVFGSAVLIAGEPGIGKSTLLMQICSKIGGERKVLYVSGEESQSQLKLRAQRLGVDPENMFVQSEVSLENILAEYERIKPDLLIIDSIQTLTYDGSSSNAGSVTQVRECSGQLMSKIKEDGNALVIVGHVNKEGGIAGPKVLEHMVDAVLYFEGERTQNYRIIRAIKNRYGSTNEIGFFEMTGTGLLEVENPSAMLLEDRPVGVPGSCVTCVMEGTRPLIAEVQALVTTTSYASPRRVSNGIDYNRMCLIIAVLEKRLGLNFSNQDVYLNVTGGIRLDDPSTDASVILSLISSLKDIPVPDDLLAIGEIGLTGDFRRVTNIEQRIAEANRLGFGRIVIPGKKGKTGKREDMIEIRNIYDMLLLFKKDNK